MMWLGKYKKTIKGRRKERNKLKKVDAYINEGLSYQFLPKLNDCILIATFLALPTSTKHIYPLEFRLFHSLCPLLFSLSLSLHSFTHSVSHPFETIIRMLNTKIETRISLLFSVSKYVCLTYNMGHTNLLTCCE